MTTQTLISGGADGADTLFEKYAKMSKHECIIYRPESVNNALKENYDQLLHFLNTTFLGRNYPTNKEYINDLIRRDAMVGLESEVIYAIAGLDNQNRILGGTAWACYTFINKCIGCINLFQDGIIPLYLFDQNRNCWYQAQVQLLYNRINYIQINQPKIITDKSYIYAGIGTRDLKNNGIAAIKLLYQS